MHLKKAINESDYFKKNEKYYEAVNNIIGYEIDNKLIHSDPIGNHANKIRIFYYRLLLNKKFINNILNLFENFYNHKQHMIFLNYLYLTLL